MDRPRRTRKSVDRYSPPPLLKHKKRRKKSRLSLVQRARQYRPSPPPRPPPKPKKIRFWNKIPKKTSYQRELEAHVFGIDGIWRIIKSYIFNDRPKIICMDKDCTRSGYHQQNFVGDYQFKECVFTHIRRGKLCKGVFNKEPIYVCRYHDPYYISTRCNIC